MLEFCLRMLGRWERWRTRHAAICPICSKRITDDQITSVWRVEHLGEAVRVHRFCVPTPRSVQLGQVVQV